MKKRGLPAPHHHLYSANVVIKANLCKRFASFLYISIVYMWRAGNVLCFTADFTTFAPLNGN